jgi:hypothetical protein
MGDNVSKIRFESQHYFKKKFYFLRIFSEPPAFTRGSEKIFFQKNADFSNKQKFLFSKKWVFMKNAITETLLIANFSLPWLIRP